MSIAVYLIRNVIRNRVDLYLTELINRFYLVVGFFDCVNNFRNIKRNFLAASLDHVDID